jgi:hypothetical protein
MTDRRAFASGTLYDDVVERWGAPIDQPVPSVRAVESGSVFKTLRPLPFERQTISVDAAMNYRRRGLVFFSGFDFDFRGQYQLSNPESHDIDVVFVFPVNLVKNKVLLSDLVFEVNGNAAAVDLSGAESRLVWTGRLRPGEDLEVDIAFRGRGLDSFTYRLDPDLPVRDFSFDLRISGGDAFDYAAGVAPASAPELTEEGVHLHWGFAALESGVPVGAILPSEQSYDTIISTMVRRSWAGFLLYFAAVHALAIHHGRGLRQVPALLLSAVFAFFSVLLPYLAAYLNFYLAYLLCLAVIGGLVHGYLHRAIGPGIHWVVAGILVAALGLPTLAVILRGHTGLIYTLEILGLLITAMWLSTGQWLSPLLGPKAPLPPPVPPPITEPQEA